MVLEEYEHAKRRGAKIYAELSGFGMSGDAYHITSPSEGGKGAALCMRNALQSARLDHSAVNYINAHGTSTIAGDIAETLAIKVCSSNTQADCQSVQRNPCLGTCWEHPAPWRQSFAFCPYVTR